MIVKHAQSEEWTQLYCSSALFKPRSAAGARIVSTHGDCHRLNLIRTDDGIKFFNGGPHKANGDWTYSFK